ncbi:TlpA family protein disulfide reductase [Candidatus Poribacteria bacterium]
MKNICFTVLLICLSLVRFPAANHPSEAIADASTEVKEPAASPDIGFESVDISELSVLDKQYLGLEDDFKQILKNIDADVVIVEFMSVYCPSCQMQAPIFNELYSAIKKDATLQTKVKMIGIGVGNNKREVKHFVEERKIVFPILPDPKFAIYERLVPAVRTPYTIMLRRDRKGSLIPVDFHLGLIKPYESYLAKIRALLQQNEDALKQGETTDATYTELKLSAEELMAKVSESMIRLSGDEDISVTLKVVSARKEPKVYEGNSKNVRFFAVVVNREPVCDVCHAIQFIYTFDEKGKIVDFQSIYLTKYGNKVWDEKDIEKIVSRVVGRSILQPLGFDPEVDAVTSATITSAVMFQALSEGQKILCDNVK